MACSPWFSAHLLFSAPCQSSGFPWGAGWKLGLYIYLFYEQWNSSQKHQDWPIPLMISGFPLVPASIHAVARAKYFNDKWVACLFFLFYFIFLRNLALFNCVTHFESIINSMVYFPSSCWMSVDTHLLYIVHGPVMAALLVRMLFAISRLILILEMLLMCRE